MSLHSRIMHLFVSCKVNRYIVGIWQFHGHGLKILFQNYSTQNDSAGISYKLRQQIKVQILTLLSSKSLYLGFIYFKNLPKNESVRKMSQNNKHKNNNFDNPLISRRTDGGENSAILEKVKHWCEKWKQFPFIEKVPKVKTKKNAFILASNFTRTSSACGIFF